MLHPVGLFEPNASSRTFKPRTLISDPATIYCRAAGAPVSMAHSTDRAIALPSWYRLCRFDPLSGVAPHAAASGGRHYPWLVCCFVEPPRRYLHAHYSFDVDQLRSR